ncbi:MAG: ferritin-like domain-containing protein [Ferruginibacter sp.]
MAGTASKKAQTQSPKKKTNAESTPRASGDNNMLKEFFSEEIKDIYWAEKHLLKTLPKMSKAATSEELANAFLDHAEMTKTHITRLEEVFGILGKKVQAKKCDAMEGITKEGEGIIEDTEAGTSTRDVGLILSAQKAEHYEIATYGGLAQLATTLGLEDIADLLKDTLQEEKDTDLLLTGIAENDINYEASEEEED